MKNKALDKVLSILYPVIALGLMLLLWQCLFWATGSEFIFPSVGATVTKMVALLGNGAFWLALLFTFLRVILCFVLSLALAIVLGTLSHLVKPTGKVINVIVGILRSAPTVALMVILTLLSNPKIAPVIVGLFVVFPMLYTNVTTSLNLVDEKLLQMCNLYNVPKLKQLQFVYLPTVLPYMLGEIPSTLSFTVKLVISAEILSNTFQSVGGLIQGANVYLDMAQLFALTILSILFATLLDGAIRLATRLLGGAK